jgi:hypothetical protein
MDEIISNKTDGIMVVGKGRECDDFEGLFGKLFG